MGRRYIYNKKRRVRKVPNNVVLEFENEKRLATTFVHDLYDTKKLVIHPRSVNLDSGLSLPPSSNHKIPLDNHDHAGLYKKPPSYDNRLLVNLEHPMTLNLKRKSVLIEHADDKSDKRLCKNASYKSVDIEMKPEVLNKKIIINKIKIEPLKKTSNVTNLRPVVNSKTICQTMATNHSSNLSKNNPTFILVSKTSIDDIGKKPINLIPNANLRQISFKTLGTRLSNSQMNNITVRHRPNILPKLASASSSHPIICVKAPNNESQASDSTQHKSILQRLTFASTSNPIICKKKSVPPSNGNILVQKHRIVNIIEENTADKNVLSTTTNEDTKKVYPVALKANNFEDSGVLEIFSNDADSEDDEMQILGI